MTLDNILQCLPLIFFFFLFFLFSLFLFSPLFVFFFSLLAPPQSGAPIGR